MDQHHINQHSPLYCHPGIHCIDFNGFISDSSACTPLQDENGCGLTNALICLPYTTAARFVCFNNMQNMQLPNNKASCETGNGILNYPLFVRTILLQGQTKPWELSWVVISAEKSRMWWFTGVKTVFWSEGSFYVNHSFVMEDVISEGLWGLGSVMQSLVEGL